MRNIDYFNFPKLRLLFITFILLLNVLTPVKEVKAVQTIGLSAKSAILMEQKTGRIIFERDAHTKRKIASITKIMTAIIAIESGKLKDEVTITPEMIKTEGSSIYLQVGEKISLEELVYGLMLRSGNDAAQAIAITVGGSLPGFVMMMNDKAAWIGMTDTNFTNPHGLDDGDKHVSTAYDMALLTKYAMGNKIFRQVSSTKVYKPTIENREWSSVWKNKNKMLTKYYKFCTGGKTGFTKAAGRTLVSTAEKNGMKLIAVTIDASDDWNDHRYMFELAYEKYKLNTFIDKGYLLGVGKEPLRNHIGLDSALIYPTSPKENESIEVKYTLLDIDPTKVSKNKIPHVVGVVELWLNNKIISSKPIYYKKNEYKKTFLEELNGVFHTFIGSNPNG
ncbi:MAG: D-alanyl-D-alanine carboxypeptidase [Bacillales bacterium]|nr:D-alanyl-D-alanine carboxypeptidase [Bacillales bacterium]